MLQTQRKICFVETNIDDISTWVDASYAVHHDMKSHTGVVLSMGLVVTHCRSIRKTLNTKSSTEPELVSTRDYVPYNIW